MPEGVKRNRPIADRREIRVFISSIFRDMQEEREEPLTVPEREELIDKYLKRYAKELDAPRRRCIAAASQASNGLYLSTLLNELRQFGSHEKLNERVEWYLQAASPFSARPAGSPRAMRSIWRLRRMSDLAQIPCRICIGVTGHVHLFAWEE
jgi:hypothetical protein